VRYVYPFIYQDLLKKMVFLGGPRQVGKTMLAKALCVKQFKNGSYFNWDNTDDKKAILKKKWQQNVPLVVFDELHKYPRWKSWIKGVYDTKPATQQYILTGSARLDTYKRGGDSLLGRYHYWRLHPFTLDELPPDVAPAEGYQRLLKMGGFPEPFIQNDEREARRWRRERFDRIIKEDVRELEKIQHINLLGLFVDALRERVGGLVTLSNIAEDLQLSANTMKNWLALVERMYLAFPVYPFIKNVPRSIQKPPKVYFYDNADVLSGEGATLENLVATHLLKRLHFIEDYHGYRCSLHYIRDKDGREVDFATVVDGKLIELIEVKTSDSDISKSLLYYADKLKPQQAIQLVGDLQRPYDKKGVRVMSPVDYFKNPPWEM